ncbi:putative peptidase (DUF1758) domain-containing protein [Phthorimaea operculella]|nr:putative peptidase (DUF1758) domain-containing protein [Phthorimaea operculella]
MATNKIKLLEQKKQSLFEITQTVYNLSLKVSEPAICAQFMARVRSIDQIRSDYMTTLDNLNFEYLTEDPETVPTYKAFNAFDELYCYIKQTETNLLQQLEEKKRKNDHLNLKLPPIQLKGFDGNPNNWPVFYENFRSVVHNNTSLSNTEKVHHLIGCLSGKALNVCSGIAGTAENYEIIWKALLDKYQDVRVQASMYLDQMLKHKPNQSIDSFIENFCSAEAALQRLNLPDLSDFIISHIALSKLDKDTLNLFEQSHKQTKIPTFENVKTFLKEQSKIQTLRSQSSQVYSQQNSQITQTQPQQCKVCQASESHPLYKCAYFLKQDPQTRLNIVKQYSFCLNCLGFHNTNLCKSQKTCHCSLRHYSLVHVDNYRNNNNNHASPQYQQRTSPAARGAENNFFKNHTPQPPQPRYSGPLAPPYNTQRPPVNAFMCENSNLKNDEVALSATSHAHTGKNTTTILSTAVVHVYDNNKPNMVRAFLDNGSMSNFITKSCCDRLNLKITPAQLTVKGIGQTESKSIGLTRLKIHSRFDARSSYTIEARVMESITDCLPIVEIDSTNLHHLKDLPLADESFCIPGQIDVIIGNELFPFLLGSNKIQSPDSGVIGIETTLGYIAAGKGECISPQNLTQNSHTYSPQILTQNSHSNSNVYSPQAATQNSHSHSHTHSPQVATQNSRSSLESRTQRSDSNSFDFYNQNTPALIINSENLKNANLKQELDLNTNGYASDTHDLSFFCQTESHSLEQLTQRFWEIENVPDKKHYSPEDEACEQIFKSSYSRDDTGRYTVVLPFKHEPSELGDSYYCAKRRFLNLEKKLDSSDLRADYNATIQTRAEYPLAAYEADNHMYMDDYVSSVSDLSTAENTYQEMVDMFRSGGFNLVKWISNSKELMSRIPLSHKTPHEINFDSDANAATKIIGMQWQPTDDNFDFHETEESKTIALPTQISDENIHPIQKLAERVSTWTKLLRTLVYVLRFSKILKSRGPISVHDLETSETFVLRFVQNKHYSQEIDAIKNNKICKNKTILKLKPFIDEKSGLLRAYGRLSHSQLNFEIKHPILLPKDRIVSLLIDYHHRINLHTGPALLLALLRQKYWILGARNLIRRAVHECNICFKFKPSSTNPPMGDLPIIRVSNFDSPSNVLSKTGIKSLKSLLFYAKYHNKRFLYPAGYFLYLPRTDLRNIAFGCIFNVPLSFAKFDVR